MSRFSRALLLALAVILLTGTIAFGYTYRSQVSISNNTSTVYPMLSVNWTANNQWMEDNGFFGAGANTTRVQTLGGLNKPHMVSDTRTLIAIPVPANSQSNLYFVTGESAQAMKIITGQGGYLTTVDAANLEYGANFTDTISGYFDATVVGNLIDKAGAYNVSGDGSGNITAGVFGGSTWTLFTGNGGVWTNPANAYDDNIGTRAEYIIGAGALSASLTLTITSTVAGSVRIHPDRSAGTITTMNVTAYNDGTWNLIYSGTPTYADWNTIT